MSQRRRAIASLMGSPHAIWVFAAAYFACYLPFTGLTKAMSRGLYPGTGEGGGPIEAR